MDGGGGGVISGQPARMPAIITGSPRFAVGVGVGTLHLDFPSRIVLGPASAGLSFLAGGAFLLRSRTSFGTGHNRLNST
jgi:hypothetical protein